MGQKAGFWSIRPFFMGVCAKMEAVIKNRFPTFFITYQRVPKNERTKPNAPRGLDSYSLLGTGILGFSPSGLLVSLYTIYTGIPKGNRPKPMVNAGKSLPRSPNIVNRSPRHVFLAQESYRTDRNRLERFRRPGEAQTQNFATPELLMETPTVLRGQLW